MSDSGKSISSSLGAHHSDTAVKSDVSTERLPTADDLETNASIHRVLSAPQRHFTCFLRTKSDGAISSSSISRPLSSLVGPTNTPLTLTLQELSAYLQNHNMTKTGQGMHDIKLNKRTYQSVHSNFTQSLTTRDDTKSGDDPSVDFNEFQQKMPKLSKNDGHSCQKLPTKSASQLLSSDKSRNGFPPMSVVRWNGKYVSSMETSIANAAAMQKVSTAGKLDVNMSEITSCTAVPLSTSNVVNISHPSATGENSTAIRRHVIVIKRCQNVSPT